MDRIIKILVALSAYNFGISKGKQIDVPKEIEEFFIELDKPSKWFPKQMY